MAKIKFSALVSDMRNKLNGSVLSVNHYGNYIRNKVTPVDPETSYQLQQRQNFGALSSQWRSLTPEERTAWNDAADTSTFLDIFGDVKKLTGQALFVSSNLNLLSAGSAQITAPASPVAVPFVFPEVYDINSNIDGTLSSATVTLSLQSVPVGFKLVVYATTTFSPGLSYIRNKFRYLGTFDISDYEIDITSALIARFGNYVIGEKVAVKTVLVSTSTGMLGLPATNNAIVEPASPVIRPFIMEVNTNNTFGSSSANNQFRLPTSDVGTYDFIVDWGDGSSDHITVWNQAEVQHTYSSIGIYEVKCTGVFRNITFSPSTADKKKILRVLEWGCLSFTNVFSFSGCSNLTLLDVVDVLNTYGGTSLSDAFTLCTSITTINRLNEWDVSSITTFSSMFNDATLFVGDVSAWDVSSATRFGLMFFNCLNFNGDLSGWDVSSATNLSQMFFGCLAFNSDISAWDVSNVTSFSSMFSGAAAFDQNLGAWNVGKGTSFTNFMAGKTPSTFSAANLDAIYNGWSALPVLVSGRTITFGTAKYTAAGSAGKAILQGAPNNWTITDGGI